MESKHIQRLQQKKIRDLERQVEEANKPGSGNLWRSTLTKAKSPRLRSTDRMQIKKYAKQRRSFLRGDGLGKTQQQSSFFKENRSKSRTALHQTVTYEEQKPADISVLFQPLNMSQTMKRASSGLKSTKKMKTTNKLIGNKSQFLISQKVNMSAIDQPMNHDLQTTFSNQ